MTSPASSSIPETDPSVVSTIYDEPWASMDANQSEEVAWQDATAAHESSDWLAPTLMQELGFLLVAAAILGGLFALSKVSLPAAAAGYVLCFTVLALWRLPLALALTLATVPFQQDLGGLPIKLSLAEVSLVMLVPILFIRQQTLPIAWRMIVPPLIYLSFCLVVSYDRLDAAAVKSLIQMGLYVIVAVGVFARARPQPADLYWCFDCLVLVMTTLAVVGLVTQFRVLAHKNGWGASLSLGLIVAFELWQTAQDPSRKKLMTVAVGILTVALMLTVSRGGWLAAMTGVGVLLVLRRDWGTLSRLAVMVVPLAGIGWLLLPEDLQEYAVGFENTRWNIKARWESIELAKQAWQQSPWFGTGVGLRKQFDATNVVLLTLAETGMVGLALFSLIHLHLGAFIWRRHTWFDPSSIAFSVVALAGALVAARLAHGMVDHYWSRGAILAAWAAVGMAVSVSDDASEGSV